MTEAAFPLLGAAFVVLFVLPACAMLAKAGLLLVERDDVGGPLRALKVRYVLLTGSSVLPLAWFLSAGLHQAETGRPVLACLFDHDAAAHCFESGFFALVLASMVAVGVWQSVRLRPALRAAASDAARQLTQRLERLVAGSSELIVLRGQLVATDAGGFAVGTHGLVRPRVFVGTAFAASLSDEMLVSALAHEREHVRARDPVRYFLLQVALAVNPFGRALLQRHALSWQTAREAQCDREAVLRGAAPLALADAIIRAARPGPCEEVALGARDVFILKLRVGLLLAFAENPPAGSAKPPAAGFPFGVLLFLTALFLPHQTGTGALDALHMGTEHALTYFWP